MKMQSARMMDSDTCSALQSSSIPAALAQLFCDISFSYPKKKRKKKAKHDLDVLGPLQAADRFAGTPLGFFKFISAEYFRCMVLPMPNKSRELHPVPSSLFFRCLDELLPIITSILNTSLFPGIAHLCFKHALVRPALKKAEVDYYRLKSCSSVSNPPLTAIVLEHTVLELLVGQVEANDLLQPYQQAYL